LWQRNFQGFEWCPDEFVDISVGYEGIYRIFRAFKGVLSFKIINHLGNLKPISIKMCCEGF